MTRVSHGRGSINDTGLVAEILRNQLQTSETDFYRCVHEGVLPPRPAPDPQEVPVDGLDAKLVRNLIKKVGLTQSQVAAMTQSETVVAWQEFLTRGIA